MTGSELVALTKQLLLESKTGVGSGLASDTEILQYVSLANQKVWLSAAQAAPWMFAERSQQEVQPAAAVSLRLGSGGGGELPAALPIDLGGGSTVVVHSVIDCAIYCDGRWRQIQPGITQDLASWGEGVPSRYYIEAGKLWLAPVSTAPFILRLTYVSEPETLSGATAALRGMLSLFHPLVAYEAAITLCAVDDRDPKGFIFLRDELGRSMLRYLAKSQRQKGRMIREVPY